MEKKTNVPKLRFPEFEGEWVTSKLENVIIEGRLGGNYENSESNNGFPVIKMGNLGRGDINLNKVQYLPNDEPYNEEDILKEGDLLFNTRNTLELVGKVSLWRNELPFALYNSNLMRIKFNNQFENSNRFLNLLFNTKKSVNQLRSFATGTTSVAAIYSRDLNKLKLSYPEVSEQTKIASFITAADDKLTQLKKKKSLLEEYKKGVMQKIFSQELRFKDDNGEDFPEWEEKTLGEVTYKVGTKNKYGIQYPIYSINNKEGFVPQSDQFDGMDSNQRGYDISLYKIVERNTFAYNPARINVGSIGYSGDLDKVIISSLYVCFKTIDIVDDYFLMHFINTDKFNKSVLTNVEGGVREYLFYENFSNIKINLPSLPEQTKIANFLSAIDEKINHCSKQIERMEEWKKGLLQQMFC